MTSTCWLRVFAKLWFALAVFQPFAAGLRADEPPTRVAGGILDAATNQPAAARITIQGAGDAWFFPASAAKDGAAVRYERKTARSSSSLEMHAALSAHPFHVDLPPGEYRFTIERGKE